jgi:predicted DNA-binding protein
MKDKKGSTNHLNFNESLKTKNKIMKTETISIRISAELKQKLEKISEETGLTNSQIIRPLIEEKAIEPETISLGEGRFYNTISDHELTNSLEFLELIFWLFDKKREPRTDENNIFYRQQIKTIDRIMQSELFFQDFLSELVKVKRVLELILNDRSIYKFNFPDEDGFDYEVLSANIHMIRFNSENDQLIPFGSSLGLR